MRRNPALQLVSLLLAVTLPASAQVATVDVSDNTNPEVSFDPDPQIYFPDIPEDLTRMYLPDPIGTANAGVSAAQSQNAVAVAAIALGASGIITSTKDVQTAPYTEMQPAVITAKPDTYSLMTGNKAAVYYIEPTEPAGPYRPASSFPLLFDFGTPTSPVASGATRVSHLTAYSASTGYGWGDITKVTSGDAGYSNASMRDYCKVAHGRAGGAIDTAKVSPCPFFVDLPNGTYKISVSSAPDKAGDTSRLSVWAEGAPEIVLSTNKTAGVTGSFTINIHDGRLMLEFFNSLDRDETTDPNTWAYVNAVTIERIPDDAPRKPTIFVASDSTAASYSASAYPITGWGARLDRFLTDDVTVANFAVPGASSKSFYERRWLKQIENRIKPGDFFFVMFAINDSADDLPGYPATKRKTSPPTTFKAYLRQYVDVAVKHGATPVFVTSQTKRTYDMWGRFFNSVGAYPDAMCELAEELDLPLIDLNQKSIDYLNAIGVDASADIYLFFEAGKYPDTAYKNGAADYIHLHDYGATKYAQLITQGIRELDIEGLSEFVLDEAR